MLILFLLVILYNFHNLPTLWVFSLTLLIVESMIFGMTNVLRKSSIKYIALNGSTLDDIDDAFYVKLKFVFYL